MSTSSSSSISIKGAMDIGDIGGEEGGSDDDAARYSDGSSDLDGKVDETGECGKSEIDDEVEGRRHSVGEEWSCGARASEDFPSNFKGVRFDLAFEAFSLIFDRDVDEDVHAEGRE